MPKPTALWCRILSFETPVRPAAVVEANREATAGGITLKLERVTDSPGQPEAVICLEPRDGVRGRVPIGEDMGSKVPKRVNGGPLPADTAVSPVGCALVGDRREGLVRPLVGEVIRGPTSLPPFAEAVHSAIVIQHLQTIRKHRWEAPKAHAGAS